MMTPSPEFSDIKPETLPVTSLRESHLKAVAELETLCFGEPWSAQSLSLLTQEGGLGKVIVWNDRVLAYGGMTMVLDEGAVTNIATHPLWRGRGLGRRIVRALLAEAQQRGLTTVSLEVRESNRTARHLYTSEGFVPCGVRKNFYRRPTEHALVMVWRTLQETAETSPQRK